MKIAALLPHVEVFGGVRRYLEIGNEFSRRGHQYVLFHPEGIKPDWLEFRGVVKPFSSLNEESFDVGLCSEYSILPYFEKLEAQVKFFYFVLEGHTLERKVTRRDYLLLGNSEGICRRIERKYGISCFRAPGGVNFEFFHPVERKAGTDEFRILCYGRIYKRRKGVRQAIRAVEGLGRKYPHIKLVLFDSLVGEDRRDPRPMIKTRIPHEFHLDIPQDRMAWLYSQGDIFISGERRAGWSNTAAEAMACRVPVVCTRSGTKDFAVHNQTALVVPIALPSMLRRQIVRLIEDEELRSRLAKAGYEKIRDFSWSSLVDRLEKLFKEKVKLK